MSYRSASLIKKYNLFCFLHVVAFFNFILSINDAIYISAFLNLHNAPPGWNFEFLLDIFKSKTDLQLFGLSRLSFLMGIFHLQASHLIPAVFLFMKTQAIKFFASGKTA